MLTIESKALMNTNLEFIELHIIKIPSLFLWCEIACPKQMHESDRNTDLQPNACPKH